MNGTDWICCKCKTQNVGIEIFCARCRKPRWLQFIKDIEQIAQLRRKLFSSALGVRTDRVWRCA